MSELQQLALPDRDKFVPIASTKPILTDMLVSFRVWIMIYNAIQIFHMAYLNKVITTVVIRPLAIAHIVLNLRSLIWGFRDNVFSNVLS